MKRKSFQYNAIYLHRSNTMCQLHRISVFNGAGSFSPGYGHVDTTEVLWLLLSFPIDPVLLFSVLCELGADIESCVLQPEEKTNSLKSESSCFDTTSTIELSLDLKKKPSPIFRRMPNRPAFSGISIDKIPWYEIEILTSSPRNENERGREMREKWGFEKRE